MTLDRRLTAIELIEQARIRDARFFDLKVPDGALVTFMNTKQRTLMLQLADAIQPLIDSSETVATVVDGALVGFDAESDNAPYYLTGVGTGYPLSMTEDGVPYVDTTAVPISTDPFGEDGGTPGFPLPVDILRLVHVVATFSDGTTSDVDVIPERSRNLNPSHNLQAFINGNRLVPVRIGISPYQDFWTNVTDVSISWIGMTTVTTLYHRIDIPTVLHECLIAGIAAILAANCEKMDKKERDGYLGQAAIADQKLLDTGRDILGQITQHSSLYRD